MLSTILVVLVVIGVILLVFGYPRRSTLGRSYDIGGVVLALLVILLLLALFHVI